MNKVSTFMEQVQNIGAEENNELLADIYNYYLKYIINNNCRGACHDSSVLLYVTLSEYGFNPVIHTGVVRSIDGCIFDHSWITVDNKIYDIAIYLPHNNGRYVSPPIFSSKNIETNSLTNMQFGVKVELENEIQEIMELTLREYLEKAGILIPVVNLLRQCNDSLKEKYRKDFSQQNILNRHLSKKRLLTNNIV